jgi:chemotaxis signal transduction protein
VKLISFFVGAEQYALDLAPIVEILPIVGWRMVAGIPPSIVGFFNYHRTPVALIDAGMFLAGRPTPLRMQARILVVTIGALENKSLLGIIVERVSGIVRCAESTAVPGAATSAFVPTLGPVTMEEGKVGGGMVQRIDLDRLLPPDVRAVILSPRVDAA